ncbi:MAG: alanine:cation symporter family protein [Bacteroidales bacterium]|nr:alanine:cation symporter family protein [Bacteroidales bacterium]
MVRDFIINLSNLICGYPLFFWLIGGGLFLFIYSRAVPLRRLGEAVRSLRTRKSGAGEISSFQALMSAISATVGMGNIAGVAIALVMGGPGAIFWMWVSALMGMATKFFEGTLTIMYKGRNDKGEVRGGPMYVITEGLGKRYRPLAVMFAAAGLIGCLSVMQANQFVEAVCSVFVPAAETGAPLWIRFAIGVVMTGIVASVVLGGIKRISKVASRLVPAMVTLYFTLVAVIIVMNFRDIPHVFASIFEGAFSLKAGIGGLAGVAITGARRAMLVNEAGVGTAMMMHGASRNAEPVREGFVAMLGPAIDSGLVCTLTAIPILIADSYHVEGVKGLAVALQSFDTLIPVAGKYLLMVLVTVFAFSTMFSYSYYGRTCSEYLFGKDRARYYDWFYLLMLLVASVITLDVAVSIMDMAFALMSVPTMFAVFKLSPKVIDALKKYKK